MTSSRLDEIAKKYNVSNYLHFHEVEEGMRVGWNRYFPSIFILNDTAVDILDHISGISGEEKQSTLKSGDEDAISDEELDAFVEELLKYKFIYEGNNDPSKDDFFKMMKDMLALSRDNIKDFYRLNKPYSSFSISTDQCNLICPYCVNEHKKKHSPLKMTFEEKLACVNKCLDQYIARRKNATEPPPTNGDEKTGKSSKNKANDIRVFFNGGEILLEWKLIKAVVNRLLTEYSELTFSFGINTNMTLMTEEIAEFMHRNQFDLSISIDGYKDSHNRTRIYRNGKGSFDDVMAGIEIYRKQVAPQPEIHLGRKITTACKTIQQRNSLTGKQKKKRYCIKKNIIAGKRIISPGNKKYHTLKNIQPLNSFQGTIQFLDDFQPENVYRMKEYGLASARLAPNLLNVSEEDAIKKAHLMKRFLDLNAEKKNFTVTELFFTNAKRIINQEAYTFHFNCQGLSAYPEMNFHLNISTMRLSHLCTYVSSPSLTLSEMEGDIYNPKLEEKTIAFIEDRVKALNQKCSHCQLIGTCVGGCIYSGLDKENEINPAGCAYQKEMWRIYLKKAYLDNKE